MRRLLFLVLSLSFGLLAAPSPPTVANITALRALLPGAHPAVQVMGYTSVGDGGGGLVNWVAASTKAAAACSVYVPTSNPAVGRWERPTSPFRLAAQCGVATLDDTISGVITYSNLAGSGTRMVVVGATGTATTQSIPAGGSLANPTATIGLAAQNGALTSGMRSDGAPALSQAIAPTWSAQHIFTVAPRFNSVTANQVLMSDGSKDLTSVGTTGTGSFMRAGSPTTTGTFTADGITSSAWAGSGTRMVVADASGVSSTQTIPAGASLANPTGTIGLTAVNGVLTSGLRSDGAPALSQAIAPTWTAIHTFASDIVMTTSRRIRMFNGASSAVQNVFYADGNDDLNMGGEWNGGLKFWVNGGTSAAVVDTFGVWTFQHKVVSLDTLSAPGLLIHAATEKTPSTFGSASGLIAINAALSDFFRVTLTGNATLDNPTNSGSTNVRSFTVRVKQDGTGSRTLAYDTDYRFPGGVPPVLTTDPNAVDYLSFILDEDADKWDFVGNAFNLLPAGS
jgi:hypothetical protein